MDNNKELKEIKELELLKQKKPLIERDYNSIFTNIEKKNERDEIESSDFTPIVAITFFTEIAYIIFLFDFNPCLNKNVEP